MRRDRFNAPLTEEEQIFAEENHFLIAKYLRKRRLPIDEWYDVVIFPILPERKTLVRAAGAA